MKILKQIATKILKHTYQCPLTIIPYGKVPEVDLEEKLKKYNIEVDLNQYLNTGDGPKFIGLLSASNPSSDKYWELVKSYWRQYCFVRYTTDELVMQFKQYNFSGDQISGMLEAIWNRYNTIGLTKEEESMLISIWDNTLFSKPAYTFKHPYITEIDRGYLFSKWALGDSLIGLLAFCAVGAKCFKISDNRYGALFDSLLREHGYLLECPDIAIWLGKIYGIAWYDEHSQMSLACIGYAASENKIFKDAGLFLANRYKHQPEIQAYAYKYLGKELPEFVIDFLKMYGMPRNILPTDMYESYFSLRSFNIQKMGKYILTPEYRTTNMYMWEEKDTVPGSYSPGRYIDFIHLYSLVNHK